MGVAAPPPNWFDCPLGQAKNVKQASAVILPVSIGWLVSTPVSRIATLVPVPVMPLAQSVVACTNPVLVLRSTVLASSRVTLTTVRDARSVSIASGVASTVITGMRMSFWSTSAVVPSWASTLSWAVRIRAPSLVRAVVSGLTSTMTRTAPSRCASSFSAAKSPCAGADAGAAAVDAALADAAGRSMIAGDATSAAPVTIAPMIRMW